MSVTLVNGDLAARSTDAARDYVLATRNRLRVEVEHQGADARARRSYQALERSISADELGRLWPHANLEVALGE